MAFQFKSSLVFTTLVFLAIAFEVVAAFPSSEHRKKREVNEPTESTIDDTTSQPPDETTNTTPTWPADRTPVSTEETVDESTTTPTVTEQPDETTNTTPTLPADRTPVSTEETVDESTTTPTVTEQQTTETNTADDDDGTGWYKLQALIEDDQSNNLEPADTTEPSATVPTTELVESEVTPETTIAATPPPTTGSEVAATTEVSGDSVTTQANATPDVTTTAEAAAPPTTTTEPSTTSIDQDSSDVVTTQAATTAEDTTTQTTPLPATEAATETPTSEPNTEPPTTTTTTKAPCTGSTPRSPWYPFRVIRHGAVLINNDVIGELDDGDEDKDKDKDKDKKEHEFHHFTYQRSDATEENEITVAVENSRGPCPEGFVKVGADTCYSWTSKKLGWQQAAAACRDLHPQAQLVAINDAKEQAAVIAVASLLDESCPFHWTAGQRANPSRPGSPIVWKQSNREWQLPFDYLNWATSTESAASGCCVYACARTQAELPEEATVGAWRVGSCDEPRCFICELRLTAAYVPGPQYDGK